MNNENSEPTTSVDRIVHTPGPWEAYHVASAGFGRVWKVIRIVDMREATSCDRSFSVWDTVTSRFVEVLGEQSWDGESDLRECVRMAGQNDVDVERIVALLPGWAKR